MSKQQAGFASKHLHPEQAEGLKPETILQEAQRLVYGPREADYDHPGFDFERTVGMINAAFKHKLKEPFAPGDFALIMVLCKVSREVHRHKRDNLVDIAGYADTRQRVEEWNSAKAALERAAEKH